MRYFTSFACPSLVHIMCPYVGVCICSARYDSRLECNATGTTLTFNTISVLPAEARRLCDAQGGTLLEQSDRLSPTANCTRTLLQNTGQMNEALLTRIECPKQDGFCYARLASGELEQMRSNNVVDNALQFICEGTTCTLN